MRWLGIVLKGRLDRYVVKSTVESYIYKFFALWRQYAFLPVPSHYRLHVMAYFYSVDFEKTSKLSTKSRVKETANVVDLEVLIRGALADKKYFRTNRARNDLITTSLISSTTTERPGAVVESSCYRGSNECMTWDDFAFWVIPNPVDPYRPLFALILRASLLKNHRDDESVAKYSFLLMEPDSHRHMDLVMYSLVAAFEDEIFEDLQTPEEIFFPDHPCTKAHQLRIKESSRTQPVFRKEVFDGKKWITSETLAMPAHFASAFYRKLSLFLGFVGEQ